MPKLGKSLFFGSATDDASMLDRLMSALGDLQVPRELSLVRHRKLEVIVCPLRDHLIIVEPDKQATMLIINHQLLDDWVENVQPTLDNWTSASTDYIRNDEKAMAAAVISCVRKVLDDPNADRRLDFTPEPEDSVEVVFNAVMATVTAFIERNRQVIDDEITADEFTDHQHHSVEADDSNVFTGNGGYL